MNTNKTKCSKCDREITTNNYKKHYNVCGNKIKIIHKPRVSNLGEYLKKGHIGTNQYIKAKQLGLPAPTLSKEARTKLSKSAKEINIKMWGGLDHEIRREKMSKLAKERKLGGHTSKRKMYYKMKDGSEVYLQSSYEIRLAELLDKLNIKWERPNPFMWIDDDGIDHRYYPDFKINSDLYIDTKNDYLAKKDARKMELVREQNKINLMVFLEKDINEDRVRELNL